MKERWFTLVCAVGALALFVAMFVRREGGLDPRNSIPRPTTVERRGNGYNAALVWLNAEGIRAISLRDRFDRLAGVPGLPRTGNLLIVTLPSVASFNTEEFLPLDRWIRAGNTLLALAALSDMPDWAFTSGNATAGDLNLLSGLEFETVRNRERRLQKHRPPIAGKVPSEAAESVLEDFRSLARAPARDAHTQSATSLLYPRARSRRALRLLLASVDREGAVPGFRSGARPSARNRRGRSVDPAAR